MRSKSCQVVGRRVLRGGRQQLVAQRPECLVQRLVLLSREHPPPVQQPQAAPFGNGGARAFRIALQQGGQIDLEGIYSQRFGRIRLRIE
jgi:hypothetical protein